MNYIVTVTNEKGEVVVKVPFADFKTAEQMYEFVLLEIIGYGFNSDYGNWNCTIEKI